MIIKGSSKSSAKAKSLADYLLHEEKNERAELIEIRGTVARDLDGAITEMVAMAGCSSSTKPIYFASLSPEPPYRLTPEQRIESVDALELELGLVGQPRAIVVHEHKGREHTHVAWCRIDV